MDKKINFTLLFYLVVTGTLFSQNDFRSGFIITNEGDTTKVEVAYRSDLKNYKSCIFKIGGVETEYLSDQIIGFGYNGYKKFSSEIIKGYFVEVLVSGKISLYKSEKKFLLKKDSSIYVLESIIEEEDIDGKRAIKEKSRWRGTLSYVLYDCLGDVNSDISNMDINKTKDITRLITRYNRCTGLGFVESNADKPWTKLEIGGALGMNWSGLSTANIKRQFPFLDNFYSSIDPSFGILVNFSSPRISERFSFQGEVHLLKIGYRSTIKQGQSTFPIYHDTHIDVTTLSVPFSFKYTITKKRNGFYIQGGASYDNILSSNLLWVSESVRNNEVITSRENVDINIKTNQIGCWGGIGVSRYYGRFKTGLAIRYSQIFGFDTNLEQGFTLEGNRISINLIVSKK